MNSATVVESTYIKSTTAALNSYEMCYPYIHLILNTRRPNHTNMNRPVGHSENFSFSGELVQQTWKIRADPNTLLVWFFFTFVEDPLFHWLSCRTEAGRGMEGGTSQGVVDHAF